MRIILRKKHCYCELRLVLIIPYVLYVTNVPYVVLIQPTVDFIKYLQH